MIASTTTWNQLNATRLQFVHFILQSARTVPQKEQDQIILGIDAAFLDQSHLIPL